MIDPSTLFENADLVAAVIPADQLFSRFNKALNLPPYWCGLVITTHGATVWCPPGTAVPGADAEQVFVIRSQPMALTFRVPDLAGSDHFACTATVRLRVRVNAEPDDVQAFRADIAGTHTRVLQSRLIDALQSGTAGGLRQFVRRHDTPSLLNRIDTAALLEILRESLQEVLFRGGLRIVGCDAAVVESPAYRQAEAQRLRLQHQQDRLQAEQQIQQAITDARSAHLNHLEQTLTRLHALAEATPQADLQDLIKTFDTEHRESLYGAMWSAGTPQTRTAWIVIASGEELLFFDPQTLDAPPRRLRLTTDAGALRSLTATRSAAGDIRLLIGAARGVLLTAEDEATPPALYLADLLQDRTVRGGFNAVALVGNRVYGTHSELGLLRWDLLGGGGTAVLPQHTANAETVRHVQFADDHIWLAIDHQVLALTLDHDQPDAPPPRVYRGATAGITALLVHDGHLLAGTTRGDILRWCVASPEIPEVLQRGHPRSVESLAMLHAGGVRRLFFANTSTSVQAQVIGDAFSCRYQAGGQTIRRSEVAADWIVGTNEHRDRVFVWRTQQPQDPPRVLTVSRITGRSIQDVTLIPTSA